MEEVGRVLAVIATIEENRPVAAPKLRAAVGGIDDLALDDLAPADLALADVALAAAE